MTNGREPAPKVLFLVTEDWYFCSHRIALARAARDAGYAVTVVTQVSQHRERIEQEGFLLVPVVFPRSFKRPWIDAWLILRLIGIYRRERAHIVHHVSMKPVLYGSLAQLFCGASAGVINALTGLGFVFTGDGRAARGLRWGISHLLRVFFHRPRAVVVLQNSDDESLLISAGVLRAGDAVLIQGSGVDLAHYAYRSEPVEPLCAVFASRLLWDKGVGEFIAAARTLKARGIEAQFVLVGDLDPGNPTSVNQGDVDGWVAEGLVDWWGWRSDMAEVFGQCHIVCLPSYREGLPKVLMEAAACGRALVAADVPGCREIVQHGETGLLVPVRDAEGLASAIETLLADPALRRRMGQAGRKLVEERFALDRVLRETLSLYDRMVAH